MGQSASLNDFRATMPPASAATASGAARVTRSCVSVVSPASSSVWLSGTTGPSIANSSRPCSRPARLRSADEATTLRALPFFMRPTPPASEDSSVSLRR
jgi:hypothetical protein